MSDQIIIEEWIIGYQRGRYSGCQWCQGQGCACCDGEARKFAAKKKEDYEDQFPDGPECVSIPMNRISDAKGAIGIEALTKAFSESGGGTDEVFDNLEQLGFGKQRPFVTEKASEDGTEAGKP